MNLSGNRILKIGLTSLIVVLTIVIGVIVGLSMRSYLEDAVEEVDFILEDRGYEHGDTFELINEYKDVSISWVSTDTLISTTGLVNTIGLTSDVEVKIVVTFVEGDEEINKDYFVTIYSDTSSTSDIDCSINPNHPTCQTGENDPDTQKIDLVKNNLFLPSETMENLNLITTSNGVTISWESDNSAITSDGVVTRSLSNDTTVTLTATFTSNDKTAVKEYVVVIPKIDVLPEAVQSISLPLESSVNIQLPLSIGEEFKVDITWESSHNNITDTGLLLCSLDENITVILTATFTYNSESITEEFIVTLMKDDAVDIALEALVLDDVIVRDILLPSSVGEVDVTWSSSNISYIDTLGSVNKQSTDVEVTLTATLNYYGRVTTKEFIVTLKKEPANKLSTPYGFVWIGDHNFFAYAKITESGYSGLMQATFTTTGEEPIVFTNTSTGGQFSIAPILEQIANGKTYTIEFVALGDGILWGDSEAAVLTFTYQVIPLSDFNNVSITDNILTFDSVTDALSYEVYVTYEGTETLYQTLEYGDNLEVVLPLEIGAYEITLVAKAPIRGDSIYTTTYTVAAENLVTLSTPNIILNNTILSWNSINNSSGYVVSINGVFYEVSNTSIDLTTFNLEPGTYDVFVLAEGDQIEYEDSNVSNVIEYTTTAPVQRVDSSGIMWQNNVAGHYSIERPPHIDPEGWLQHEYIVRIYQNGELVAEASYNNSSNVVHVQVPGQTGIFSGLSAGNYTVEVILVGNNTTHSNSEPATFNIYYAG